MFCLRAMHRQPHGLAWIRTLSCKRARGFTSAACGSPRRQRARAQEQDDLFVVGTEEGFLHKCSSAFNAEYVASYARHDGAVYAVAWNRRHGRVFLSASADWTVRLWHDARPKARAPAARSVAGSLLLHPRHSVQQSLSPQRHHKRTQSRSV